MGSQPQVSQVWETEAHRTAAEPLFRAEAVAEQRTQWLGAVLLEPRASSTVVVTGAAVAAVLVVALLFFGSFTRKERINGWLMPQQGVVRIVSPQPGVVTQIHAREGMKVTRGTPLVALSGEVQSQAVGATRGEVVRRLVERRDSMLEALTVQRRLLDQQATVLSERLSLLARENRSFVSEISLLQDQVQSSERLVTAERMRAANYNAKGSTSIEQRNHFELDARLQSLQRSRAAHEREIVQLQGTMVAFPLRRQNELAETERSLAALEQELAEAEARREIVIVAPQDGTVTGIQIELGGNTTPSVPLMSIVPVDSILEAHLFSASRAIGFMRPGQQVLLRYQAFPYQKFGLYEGVIKSISQSAISPSELTKQLSGLTNLVGTNEPVYRVTVELAQQSVTAYGQPVALQPGMQLEADVMVDTRRLIEWVLDPLYSLTGKLAR